MKRAIEIRPMRIDDLRGVFLLGREVLPSRGTTPARDWNEKNVAAVLARGLECSLVAMYKKNVAGFIIALPEEGAPDGGAVTIQWLCAGSIAARSGKTCCAPSQLSMSEMKYPRIRADIPAESAELYDLFRKFDFTESKHLLIMENFPPKKNG